MSHYVLRYFFDGVTGTCLWAGNAETADAFDYPVDLYMLNLPDSLLQFGNQVIDRWTTLVNLGDATLNETEDIGFRVDARKLLIMLRNHLGSDFEILDESWR